MIRKSLLTITIIAFQSIIFGQSTVNYTSSTTNIANPERGLYHHTETHSGSYSLLSSSQMQSWRQNDKISLVLRVFYMENFISSPISAPYLSKIQQDFDSIRKAGVKCIVRFAYSDNTGGAYDATKSQIIQHIGQLKPYLINNADVISVVETGFIGVWGEWYYTDYFGIPPNSSDYLNRKEVTDSLLSALPTCRMIQLRTPKFKMQMYSPTALPDNLAHNGTNKARIGHHNDCFLASPDDYGTYDNAGVEYPYLSQETKNIPMGGETCNPNLPRSGCATGTSEMELFHWSYLNIDYHPTVINNFVSSGCFSDIENKLGYRLELTSGTYEDTVTDSLNIQISLKNTGYAAPYNPRAVNLILRNTITTAETEIKLNLDPRLWYREISTISLNETVDVSSILPGDYDLFLHLPDTFSNLSTRPEYAIQFANIGLWEPSTGYNNLNQTITIENNTVGTNDNEFERYFSLFPNPANDVLTIKSKLNSNYSFKIYDVTQKLIISKENIQNSNYKIDMNSVKNGTYFVNLTLGNKNWTEKITILH